ncbi:aspartate/glutamate racemase family protein [uncultured Nocardioides sp.]|uniref:aspartate/glutamate racemase family protein n=1 Tax=uncultured Nocardioides sp. TaxID=198441 RepID=UPI00261D2F19|nr:aspartate/glutamate racemase family protein [uncultured Nocardioides sp.]
MAGPRMRKIGLLGGMSWESSALYYEILNEAVRERLGGYHSARVVMSSVDFAEVEAMQAAGEWDAAGALLAAEAAALEAAGAECLVLCTNTMHKVADAIEAATEVPLVHIVDVTAATVRAAGLSRVALLGTRFTMEQAFVRDRLATHGVEALVPPGEDRELVHEVIYGELVHGVVREASRAAYVDVVDRLVADGAEGVVLGCTEIELLLRPEDVDVPVFATTRLHALAALDLALS